MWTTRYIDQPGEPWRQPLEKGNLVIVGAAYAELADFLIGAHAAVNGYRLLTLDAGLYRASFPKLVTLTV
jgi:predicted nucleic acid-binding protein